MLTDYNNWWNRSLSVGIGIKMCGDSTAHGPVLAPNLLLQYCIAILRLFLGGNKPRVAFSVVPDRLLRIWTPVGTRMCGRQIAHYGMFSKEHVSSATIIVSVFPSTTQKIMMSQCNAMQCGPFSLIRLSRLDLIVRFIRMQRNLLSFNDTVL